MQTTKRSADFAALMTLAHLPSTTPPRLTDDELAWVGWTDSVDSDLLTGPWDGLRRHPVTVTELREMFDAGLTPTEATALLDYCSYGNYQSSGITHERWDELTAQFRHVMVSDPDACAYDELDDGFDAELGGTADSDPETEDDDAAAT